MAFVSSALSWTLGEVFWQQSCDAGISICPHWFFIMRQQACSSVFICALGTMQAIAGARHDTSSKTSTPNWRRTRILVIRLLSLTNGANSDSISLHETVLLTLRSGKGSQLLQSIS